MAMTSSSRLMTTSTTRSSRSNRGPISPAVSPRIADLNLRDTTTTTTVTPIRGHRYSYGSGSSGGGGGGAGGGGGTTTSSGSERHDVITNSDLDRLRRQVAFSDSDTPTSGDEDEDEAWEGEEGNTPAPGAEQSRFEADNLHHHQQHHHHHSNTHSPSKERSASHKHPPTSPQTSSTRHRPGQPQRVPRVPSYREQQRRRHGNKDGAETKIRKSTGEPEMNSAGTYSSNNQNAHANNNHRKSKQKSEHGFLRDVQHELEDQRSNWSYEVDRLLARDDSPDSSPSQDDDNNNGRPRRRRTTSGLTSAARAGHSYVDTSRGQQAVFTAFVDVREYPAKHVTVHVDSLTNQLVVKAEEATPLGAVTKTFTQKLSLPRFADERFLESKMNNQGLLRIRVPLLYHFAQKHLDDVKKSSNQNRGQVNAKDAKAFVYQVTKGRDGKERLELLVNTGTSYSTRDLEVAIDEDNRLLVSANNGIKSRLLKQYTLPQCADVDGVTSRLTKDGRLQVNIPLDRADH